MFMLLRPCAHMKLLPMASANFATSLRIRSGETLDTLLIYFFLL